MLEGMRVEVLVFGVLKDLLKGQSPVDLPEGATVRTLLDHFRSQLPDRTDALASIAVAVNQQYAVATQPLRDGDEVALLPPVSGGSESHVALVHESIPSDVIVGQLKQGEDGAVVVFDGIVRNNTRDRRTQAHVVSRL